MSAWRRNSSSSLPCGSNVPTMKAVRPTTVRTRRASSASGRATPRTPMAMEAEIDTVERAMRLELSDHPANEGLVGLLRDPPRARAGLRPQRRFDANQLDAVVLARHFHEAANVGMP